MPEPHRPLLLEDFDYPLPDELIARHPPERRGQSRLLRVLPTGHMQPGVLIGPPHESSAAGTLIDTTFDAFADCFEPGELIVMNDTRVIRSRLHGRKATGGRVEAMIESLLDVHTALAMLRASHFPADGSTLEFRASQPDSPKSPSARAVVVARATGPDADRRFATLRFEEPVLDVLDRIGELPVPPYLQRPPTAEDDERYQTVYAAAPGAAAAPTAGLHFDEAMLQRLRSRGVDLQTLTLHVGAGTFLPVSAPDIASHRMHSERYEIPPRTADAIAQARRDGRRITAIGTTTLRALEASEGKAGAAQTAIFIRPGYTFRVVDRLLTNFHLPRSTLLMLVSAFAGVNTIRCAYRYAIDRRYRFFSYGDATLLERAPPPEPTR